MSADAENVLEKNETIVLLHHLMVLLECILLI